MFKGRHFDRSVIRCSQAIVIGSLQQNGASKPTLSSWTRLDRTRIMAKGGL
jgi:hypothetical protein